MIDEMSHPEDIEYTEGDIGDKITWLQTIINPSNFIVQRDYAIVDLGAWAGEPIVVSVDGLKKGVYRFTCTTFDQDGHNASDTVEVTVLKPNSAPSIDHPNDLTISEGSYGNIISWNPSDTDPESFLVFKADTIMLGGPWNGRIITVGIDSFEVGLFQYTCVVYDTDRNSINDSVIVTVSDEKSPIINHPADIIIIEGIDIGTTTEITWEATDTNPATYSISQNGTEVESGVWNGGSISFDISDLEPSNYSIVCTVVDEAGNSASDTVFVGIIAQPGKSTPWIQFWEVLLILGLLIGYKSKRSRKN